MEAALLAADPPASTLESREKESLECHCPHPWRRSGRMLSYFEDGGGDAKADKRIQAMASTIDNNQRPPISERIIHNSRGE